MGGGKAGEERRGEGRGEEGNKGGGMEGENKRKEGKKEGERGKRRREWKK